MVGFIANQCERGENKQRNESQSTKRAIGLWTLVPMALVSLSKPQKKLEFVQKSTGLVLARRTMWMKLQWERVYNAQNQNSSCNEPLWKSSSFNESFWMIQIVPRPQPTFFLVSDHLVSKYFTETSRNSIPLWRYWKQLAPLWWMTQRSGCWETRKTRGLWKSPHPQFRLWPKC